MSKPVTPDEVATQKVKDIPGAVIDAWNELIVRNFHNGESTVLQKDIVALILSKMEVDRATIFSNNWLSIESIYEAAGWKVTYDKPGYNEFYDATFVFRKKRGRVNDGRD